MAEGESGKDERGRTMSAADSQELGRVCADAVKGKPMLTVAERLLTMRELAERLRVSRVTAWRCVAERNLKCIRIGRAVRIRERDLEAWLERNATGGDGDGGAA